VTSSSADALDPLELYDEMVMGGTAPDPKEFCRGYPEHPDLLKRIEQLEALRVELDGIARDLGRSPEWPSEIGGFRLVKRLAQGGMGVVFVGENIATKQTCAVKLLASRSALALERFRREARVIRELAHPSIPTAFGFGVVRGQAFLATELLSGTSVADLLQQSHGMTPVRSKKPLTAPPRNLLPMDLHGVVRIVRSVAEALGHAHRHGIVHRDVKPANIMITDDHSTKLIDFGLAFESSGERLTAQGTFLGSAAYAAPEQLKGDQSEIGPWTDTYSVGVTLFEMLTHLTPFGESKRASEREKLPVTPREHNSEVPRSLDRIVKKALSFQSKKRYRDGAELANVLTDWMS
jgi:eukaryotic-like serine/threonine-protein kinase